MKNYEINITTGIRVDHPETQVLVVNAESKSEALEKARLQVATINPSGKWKVAAYQK